MKIAVLKGGRSLERSVSLRSGARVEDALERLGHEVLPLEADGQLVRRLADERPDVAFVAMHGLGGEDGTAQELLEILGIPFTGPSVAACVRCVDKSLSKHDLRAGGEREVELQARDVERQGGHRQQDVVRGQAGPDGRVVVGGIHRQGHVVTKRGPRLPGRAGALGRRPQAFGILNDALRIVLEQVAAAQIEVVGVGIGCRLRTRKPGQPRTQGADDGSGDLVLHLKDVLDLPLVLVAPERQSIGDARELHR